MRRSSLVVLALVASAYAPAAARAGLLLPDRAPFSLPVVRDAADGSGALDLRRVTFGQRETFVVLRLRTARAWRASSLGPSDLCVVLTSRSLCVGSDGRGRTVLSMHPTGAGRLVARGAPQLDQPPGRAIRAVVTRPTSRSLVARFRPRELGFGAVRWFVRSRRDRAPDRGSRRVVLSAFGAPSCFGAAARAHARPCANRALRRVVVPSPSRAIVMPDGACRPVHGGGWAALQPCELGLANPDFPPRIALVGDSHTQHFRAAIDVLAQARGWKAMSLTRPGCAFSTEVYPAPAPIPGRCRRHSSEALAWLRAHPAVESIVTSSSAGRGFSSGGFTAIWRQVPPSVKRILVIRDVPRVSYATASCVGSVLRRGGASSRACSVSRGSATLGDPSAAAAAGARGRVRLLDLTRFFCDAARCYPIVGGAYVYKDFNHINSVFSASLGPFILRAL